MMIVRVLSVALALLWAGAARANCMNTDEGAVWRQQYPRFYGQLVELLSCHDGGDSTACNVFAARAAEKLFNVKDFKRADGTYLTANQIIDYVTTFSGEWSKLGLASEQAILNEAAKSAQNQLVIAVISGGKHGHVALVLPGAPLQEAGKWSKLLGRQILVPNSASMFLGDADAAYVFCRLSWAFKDPRQVEIWRRLP